MPSFGSPLSQSTRLKGLVDALKDHGRIGVVGLQGKNLPYDFEGLVIPLHTMEAPGKVLPESDLMGIEPYGAPELRFRKIEHLPPEHRDAEMVPIIAEVAARPEPFLKLLGEPWRMDLAIGHL